MNMTTQDIRLICTALGFTAVVAQGNANAGDSALRAEKMAQLIEAFCRTKMPEAFVNAGNDEGTQKIDELLAQIQARGNTK